MIVRDDDVLGGRWRLEGTRIPVSTIANMVRETGDPKAPLEAWPWLTEEQIAACVAWEFPAIRPAPEYNAVGTLYCTCGETIEDVGTGHRVQTCESCGKRWIVTATVDAAPTEQEGTK